MEPYKGKPFVFVLDFSSGESLTLATTTSEERDKWVRFIKQTAKLLAVRKHRAGEGLNPDQAWPEARATRPKRSRPRSKRRRPFARRDVGRGRKDAAAALGDTRNSGRYFTTLKQQGEQIEQTTRDLDRMNHELKQADRNLSQLESWRIFGGKSKRKGGRRRKWRGRIRLASPKMRKNRRKVAAAAPPVLQRRFEVARVTPIVEEAVLRTS